jgi:hypothetical protein
MTTTSLSVFTVEKTGTSLVVTMGFENLSDLAALRVGSYLGECVQHALTQLASDAPLTLTPHASPAPAAEAPPASPVESPPLPPKRKRRTRAQIAADEAAAAQVPMPEPEPPIRVTPVSTSAPVAPAPAPAPAAPAPEPEPEPAPEPAPAPAPEKPKAMKRDVETGTVVVQGETFQITWARTGAHTTGRVVIHEALAARLGGEPTTFAETSDSRSAVRDLLSETLSEYLDQCAYAKQLAQQAALEPATAPEAPAPKPAPKPKAPAPAPEVHDDPDSGVTPKMLQYVIDHRKPSREHRAGFVRMWCENLYENADKYKTTTVEAAAAFILRNQGAVTWFSAEPLKASVTKVVESWWQMRQTEDAKAAKKEASAEKATSGDVWEVDEEDILYGEGE